MRPILSQLAAASQPDDLQEAGIRYKYAKANPSTAEGTIVSSAVARGPIGVVDLKQQRRKTVALVDLVHTLQELTDQLQRICVGIARLGTTPRHGQQPEGSLSSR